MSDDVLKEIDDAAAKFDMPKLMRLTGLPEDVLRGERIMSRKDRRKWYFQNKDRLNLPEWDQLQNLVKK